MRTQQDKVLADFAALITAAGFEPVQRAEYGNIGTIGIQSPTAVVEYAQLRYDFQSGTMKFALTVEGVPLLSQPPRPNYFDFYMNATDTDAYQAFRRVLDKALATLQLRHGTPTRPQTEGALV